MELNNIFSEKIVWKKRKRKRYLFDASIQGKSYALRNNNFPEEPMYTVTDGSEFIDFDEKPICWKIEYFQGKLTRLAQKAFTGVIKMLKKLNS